jgi:hypothetical protein
VHIIKAVFNFVLPQRCSLPDGYRNIFSLQLLPPLKPRMPISDTQKPYN